MNTDQHYDSIFIPEGFEEICFQHILFYRVLVLTNVGWVWLGTHEFGTMKESCVFITGDYFYDFCNPIIFRWR